MCLALVCITFCRNCCKRTWLLPIKFDCFSGKNLKCFVTDYKIGHHSETAAFQLPCQVAMFNFVLFFYKMKPWISNSPPPEIEELEFTTPSNRPQLSRWKVAKSYKKFGDNPDTLEFGLIKFQLKFCLKLFSTKTFSRIL